MGLTSFDEFIKGQIDAKVIDYHNPNCENCNDCCSMGSLLTNEEYEDLSKLIKKNPIVKRAFENGLKRVMDWYKKGTTYWMCPFSDPRKRCAIYNKRPLICREFHCSPELQGKQYDKTIYGDKPYTIYHLFDKRIGNEINKLKNK